MNLVNLFMFLIAMVLLLELLIVMLEGLMICSFISSEVRKWCFFLVKVFIVVKGVLEVIFRVAKFFVFLGF